MTILSLRLRYHAVGIHVSRGPRTSINQSNSRVYRCVHLRNLINNTVLGHSGTVLGHSGTVLACLALFGTPLALYSQFSTFYPISQLWGRVQERHRIRVYGTLSTGIWDPEYGYGTLSTGIGPWKPMGWALAIPRCTTHPVYPPPRVHHRTRTHASGQCLRPACSTLTTFCQNCC